MSWFIVGGIVTVISLAIIAVCKLVFGVVALLSVPADQRLDTVRAIGEAWRSWSAPSFIVSLGRRTQAPGSEVERWPPDRPPRDDAAA